MNKSVYEEYLIFKLQPLRVSANIILQAMWGRRLEHDRFRSSGSVAYVTTFQRARCDVELNLVVSRSSVRRR